jgi:hypothetical protein
MSGSLHLLSRFGADLLSRVATGLLASGLLSGVLVTARGRRTS